MSEELLGSDGLWVLTEDEARALLQLVNSPTLDMLRRLIEIEASLHAQRLSTAETWEKACRAQGAEKGLRQLLGRIERWRDARKG